MEPRVGQSVSAVNGHRNESTAQLVLPLGACRQMVGKMVRATAPWIPNARLVEGAALLEEESVTAQEKETRVPAGTPA